MKNISFKVGLIYILFTIFNISFFTVSIYIEQNELIIKNREFETLLRTEKVYSPLKYLIIDSLTEDSQDIIQNTRLKKITDLLGKTTQEEYIIFTENGDLLYQSSDGLALEENNRTDSISAIANREFLNQPYLLQTYNTNDTYLYIPIGTWDLEEIVILFKFKMESLEASLESLYRLVITVIAFVLTFQIIFGIVFYSMVIKPVKEINKKSLEIKSGNLSSRANLKRKDEIGQLGRSFDEMAATIEEKILQMEEKNKIMEFELKSAGEVQAGIYPKLRKSDFFNVAVHHKPLGIVSGDYHDIFKVSSEKYGFLIVDVSGHGVPAALTTLRIQNTFKRLVTKYEDTGKLFANINNELVDLMEKFSCYFTAFYFSLDTNSKIIYTNGGHPSVYLLRARMKKIFELKTGGFPLGLTNEANEKFHSKTTKIEPGDKVILFSDGIIEAKNKKGVQYSTDRLLHSIMKNAKLSCEAMNKNIIKDLNLFTKNAKRKDDETLMIIEVKKQVQSTNTPKGKISPGTVSKAKRMRPVVANKGR